MINMEVLKDCKLLMLLFEDHSQMCFFLHLLLGDRCHLASDKVFIVIGGGGFMGGYEVV